MINFENNFTENTFDDIDLYIYVDDSVCTRISITKEIYEKCKEVLYEKYNISDLKDTDTLPDNLILYTIPDNKFPITVNTFMNIVYKECDKNIWFFFRELVKVYVDSTGKYRPFKFNKGTYLFILSYICNRKRVFLYNPRQTCNTIILHCLYLYIKIFKCKDVGVEYIACADYDKLYFDSNIERMLDHMPKLIRRKYNSNFPVNQPIRKYILIDNYEYNYKAQLSDQMFNITKSYDNYIYASSTINDDMDSNMIHALYNNTKLVDSFYDNYMQCYYPRILLPEELILDNDDIERLKRSLNDETLIRKEIHRQRAVNIKYI